MMKRVSKVVLVCAVGLGAGFVGSCERHDWEVTRKLHHHGGTHGGSTHGEGGEAGHAEAPHAGEAEEAGSEPRSESESVSGPASGEGVGQP